MPGYWRPLVSCFALIGLTATAFADENLFGYLKGAEPLPKGAREIYAKATSRNNKGIGSYSALDLGVEFEYGFTDRLSAAFELKGISLETSGIVIDGYLPGDRNIGPTLSGFETSLKYNFLSPAKSSVGISLYTALDYSSIDPHSGQDKDTLSLENRLLLQKYFLDGQLIWVSNIALEVTRAVRAPIDNLPPDFDWPTEPEMEVEIGLGTGLSYRFAPNWFIGVEGWYEQENETEVGLERWSLQAGPSLHYGGQKWWATLTWLPQLRGGGETYPGQSDENLHLVEKTKVETRLKVGVNF
jgi:hypothetical protein